MTNPTIAQTFDKWWIELPGFLDTPCHIWTRGKTGTGYGHLRVAGKGVKAHRFAWERVHGEIPQETPYIFHDCGVRACVNPGHLRMGTFGDMIKTVKRQAQAKIKVPNLVKQILHRKMNDIRWVIGGRTYSNWDDVTKQIETGALVEVIENDPVPMITAKPVEPDNNAGDQEDNGPAVDTQTGAVTGQGWGGPRRPAQPIGTVVNPTSHYQAVSDADQGWEMPLDGDGAGIFDNE